MADLFKGEEKPANKLVLAFGDDRDVCVDVSIVFPFVVRGCRHECRGEEDF